MGWEVRYGRTLVQGIRGRGEANDDDDDEQIAVINFQR